MSPIALHPNPELRDDLDSPADAQHPPAGVVAARHRAILVRGIPWLALAATAILGFFDRGFTQRWDTFPFLISFLIFGSTAFTKISNNSSFFYQGPNQFTRIKFWQKFIIFFLKYYK